MCRDLKKLIMQMTLEEKAGLCSGLDFWKTKSIDRLGIPSIMMTDGPHGLRKQAGDSDHLGLNKSVPATCFPTAAGLACSWDRNLLQKIGIALGEECQAENIGIILGPGTNIKRSPLCGRNFEYFSEDPYLSSEMAAGHINGVQSQGVGASLKHFAANNQEHRRMTIDTIADERTLREIYLASFENAVKQSKPWTVMCSYNKLNGEYCSENKYLLNDILREQWGFEGLVVSDWGAVNQRADGMAAGLDLEMPYSYGTGDKKIVDAVKTGKLPESVLNAAVERILNIVFKVVDKEKQNATYDRNAHHKLAREAARECMVLLKNEDAVLPLKKSGSIALIGAFAKNPRYQGGGSSHINPSKLDNILEEITRIAGDKTRLTYADGYQAETDDINEELINQAKQTAANADVAIVFAGLPDRYESEGYDRQHMGLPKNHTVLIESVAEVQSKVVVVLSNGSPVEMPWIGKVKGLLECYLGGQAQGGAIADVLFGAANPCGKLAETFPIVLNDNPSYLNFPGEGDKVEYREGIFVGYRYYDKKNIKTLFPFGYGLSYTTFEYTDILVDKKEISDKETLKVFVKVKNTGNVIGKEIVQLYVRDKESSVSRPEKELKGFEKLELKPGEEKAISFSLDKRSFAYYSTELCDWHVETGEFEIIIGGSSRDIQLKETVKVNSTADLKKKFHRNSTLGDMMVNPAGIQILKQMIEGVFEEDVEKDNMMAAFIKYLPVHALSSFSRGKFTDEMMEGYLEQLNNI